MSLNRFLNPATVLQRYDALEDKKKRPLAGRLAALYERVSGDRQANEETIQTQDYYLRQYCEANWIIVVDVYRDNPAKNDVPMGERPEGHRLLEDAKAGRFDLVLVHGICRWSREEIIYKQAQHALGKLGIDLDCPSEHLEWGSPGQDFASDVRLRSNKLIRDIIHDNCMNGKYSWAAKGAGLGSAPHYGYIKIPAPDLGKNRTRYEIDTPEASVIRRIFDLLVRQRMSCRKIAALLNAEQVPLPSQSPKWKDFTKHTSAVRCKGKWSASRVSQICRNRLYTGACLYGGDAKRRPVLRTVPAIIPIELFEAAQRQLESNSKRSTRSAKRPYLLSGKLWCDTCQAAYTGITENNGQKARSKGWTPRPVYRCQGYQKKFDGEAGVCCPFYRISGVLIEDDAWQATVAYLQGYDERLQQLHEEWSKDSKTHSRLQIERDGLLRKMSQLDEEARDAKRGKSRLDFDLTREEATAILQKIDGEKKQLNDQLQEIQRTLQQIMGHQRHVESAEEYLDRYRENLGSVTDPQLKQEIIGVFLETAIVTQGEAGECLVTYRFYAQDPVVGCTPLAKATARPYFFNWCVNVVHALCLTPKRRGRKTRDCA
jgi:site-specific DNA recombinase